MFGIRYHTDLVIEPFFDHDISNSESIGGYYVVRDEDFVYNPRISVNAPVGPVTEIN